MSPTYDYLCQDCGVKFETRQQITEPPLKHCIKCGGSVKRLIGSGSCVIFRGSGFWQNDSKDKRP